MAENTEAVQREALGLVVVSDAAAAHIASVGGNLDELLCWHRQPEPTANAERKDLPRLPHRTGATVAGARLVIETRALAGEPGRRTVVTLADETGRS